MPLTIELLPDPAANDLRLTELVSRRSTPLERLNILHGSGLQRLATQRMLARASGGGLAAFYGFTPVDLAQLAAQLGNPPPRIAWPRGADLASLERVLSDLTLPQLDPVAPGVPQALLRTLTDLREAALTPDRVPEGALRTVFAAWRDALSGAADRTSRYEDAVAQTTPRSAFQEALGGAPLVVSGIYDLTRIQRLLLARLADAVDVHMLLIAPSDAPASPPRRTLDALCRELQPRVVQSAIPPTPLAPHRFFSVGDPTAEADEIAQRILQLGREGIAFHRVAILHQQGAPGDDRLCAALDRAQIPSWRIGGRQLSHSPVGFAVQSLIRILLNPSALERTTLIDWLSHRALQPRPLGITAHPTAWDQIAVEAGLTRGLSEMRERLESWHALSRNQNGRDLADILADLCSRSQLLAEAESWSAAAQALVDAVDAYIADRDDNSDQAELLAASRETIGQVAANDALGSPWSQSTGLTALNRALGASVVRDPRRLVGGVNIGAATGPARGIRYDAIFAAGVAERVFPAVGRQDPLLNDRQRAEINARIPDALALQRERSDSDRQAWDLLRSAARVACCASWSRRSSAVGGPARPSTFILEAAAASLDPAARPYSEQSLGQLGRIQRIASVGVAAVQTELNVGKVADQCSLELSMLSAANVDINEVLPQVWPESDSAIYARQRRSRPAFTEFDGLLHADQLDNWRPLERSWSAAALETLVTCPYRFYLRNVVGARGDDEADRPDRKRRDALARLIRRILSTWVREYEHFKSDRTWFEYADSSSYLNTVARRILDSPADTGILGPPAAISAARSEIMRDLDRARRRESLDARDGWRPLEVNVAFEGASIRVSTNRTLLLQGVIDRLDAHVGGRYRALSFYAGRTLPDVRGFINGSSFDSIASLAAMTQRGIAIRDAEVEHRSVTARGEFQSQRLTGESLITRGSASAPSDAERLGRTLAVVADHLESANFIPEPGQPARERPNCRQCAYESTCTPDLVQRLQHKTRHDPDPVRELTVLRRQRP